jgi:hypothetical protein
MTSTTLAAAQDGDRQEDRSDIFDGDDHARNISVGSQPALWLANARPRSLVVSLVRSIQTVLSVSAVHPTLLSPPPEAANGRGARIVDISARNVADRDRRVLVYLLLRSTHT